MRIALSRVLLLSLLAASTAPAQSWMCQYDFDGPVFRDNISMGGPNLLLGIKTQARLTMQVVRLEVFTGERSGTNTLAIWTHDPVNNQPGASLGMGSWSMSSTNSWQGADLATPVQLTVGTDFWVVWGPQNAAQASIEATQTGGLPGSQTYRGSFDNGLNWNGPWLSHQWKFRIYCGSGTPGTYQDYGSGCAGSNGRIPDLGAVGLPNLGGSFGVDLGDALPGAPVILWIGASDQTWYGLTLPFDLGPAGAPGCSVLCSTDIDVATAADGSGQAVLNFTIPSDGSLVGRGFYNQWWVYDPAASPLGFAFSEGGAGLIGP